VVESDSKGDIREIPMARDDGESCRGIDVKAGDV
jgi:hypothetical protein